MCFVDLEKAFDIVPRKLLEWALRKKGIPEVLVRLVVRSELSEEFEVKVEMHQGSVLSPILYVVVVDVVTEFVREGALSELLYADDIALMSEIIEGLRNKSTKWKEAFKSKGLKVNIGRPKVMISGGITQDGLSKNKVDTCGVCSLRVKDNSVLCSHCGKWVHGRCAGVKMVTQKFSRNLACRKCEGNIGQAVEQEEMLCDEVETVREFTYLSDMVSAGGGCEAAVTATTNFGWVKFRECGELLYGRIFPLRLIGAVHKSYVRPAMQYGSEAWCLKESEMEILLRTERFMVRAMCGVQLKDRKISTDLMFMLV